MTSRYVCFQRFHSLVAADPQTGAVLWVRHDVPAGSEVFGDDEYLFVVSPEREEATLVRAADGEVLGTRKVPRPPIRQVLANNEERILFHRLDESYLGTLGRRLLEWQRKGRECELALVDPLDGRDLWPRRKFSAAARASVVEGEAVGVLEPSRPLRHAFAARRPHDRRPASSRRRSPLAEITLLRSGDQYFLMTHDGGMSESVGQVPNVPSKLVGQGNLYALDAEGQLQWPAPVTIRNQYLPLHQPASLPVLTFICHSYQQTGRGMEPKSRVLCIDKRTGARCCTRTLTTPLRYSSSPATPRRRPWT